MILPQIVQKAGDPSRGHHNRVFRQFLDLLPRHEFDAEAQQQKGERLRVMSRWAQFVALGLGQLGGLQSLRDIVSNLCAQPHKLYHLGVQALVSRSSLARVNAEQPYTLYEALFSRLLARCRQRAPRHGFRFKNGCGSSPSPAARGRCSGKRQDKKSYLTRRRRFGDGGSGGSLNGGGAPSAYCRAWFRSYSRASWKSQYASKSPLARNARSVDVTVILDIIHAVEYVWKAAHVFHREGSPDAAHWAWQAVAKRPSRDRQARSWSLHWFPWRWENAGDVHGRRRCGWPMQTCHGVPATRSTSA